jgi:predicted nucleotidyltransferase
MSKLSNLFLSKGMQSDLEQVLFILTKYPIEKIIFYGSLARGDYRDTSDIDICVKGLPDQNFFLALAECLLTTEHAVSLTDFDQTTGYFRQRILTEGKILYESLRVNPRSSVWLRKPEQTV